MTPRQGEVFRINGQIGACGQAHEIHGIGCGPGLIEIVDSPDQTAFDVPPGSKVLHMQIADREHVRSSR
jgi:hypothetical protein